LSAQQAANGHRDGSAVALRPGAAAVVDR